MTRWQRRGTLSLIGGLAGLLMVELIYGAEPEPPRSVPLARSASIQHDPAASSTETADQLATLILARPLFSPDRRPPATNLQAPPARQNVLPRLSGVIVDGTRRLAIFAAKDGKSIVAATGETVAGWVVSAVQPDGVLLAGPGIPQHLHPMFALTRASAPQPAPPPPDPVSVAVANARRALLARLE